MRLRKFYGRSLNGALDQVRRELGDHALIVESRSIHHGSAIARLHPGAKFEVTAAIETEAASPRRSFKNVLQERVISRTKPEPASAPAAIATARPAPVAAAPRPDFLNDLASLKKQIRDLLDGNPADSSDVRDQHDLNDYRLLVAQGVDHTILAPHFREWLDAHTARGAMPAPGFREWLCERWWNVLTNRPESASAALPIVVGLTGGNGVGKSTTMAKMASLNRQSGGKNVAVISLDGLRPGANDQWRRFAKLMDVAFFDFSNQEESKRYGEILDRFGWIGIDTPGGMTPETAAGRLYGSLLARSPLANTFGVLDATSRDQANREQIRKMQPFGTQRLIFSKLDQSSERGGMLNLTFDGKFGLEAACAGPRVPQDLAPATRENLWHWVFETQATSSAAAGTEYGVA